ncbi:MAG: ribonuclease III [Candidatus Cloacimonetes bacterium]|nr:ribonuclease III [Candidatus Cloacimonadota bacterium]
MKNIISIILNQIAGREHKIKNLAQLETTINYRFKNISLINAALSHTSLMRINDKIWPFERMEFLGDSILGLVVAELLFKQFPDYSEGDLSKLKSKLVSRKYLAIMAREINLGKYILLSSEAELGKGRDSSTILCDTIEAMICAIYIDSGLPQADKFIRNILMKDFMHSIDRSEIINFKSILQEYTQAKYKNVPIYKIIDETGPDHEKVFTVEILINDIAKGIGTGANKKTAEQNAAKVACEELELLSK